MQYYGLAGTKQSLSLSREQELLESMSLSVGRVVDGGAGYLRFLIRNHLIRPCPPLKGGQLQLSWEKEAPHLSPVWPEPNHSGF